jgi:Mg2+ and Co2+ transporter CorA
MRSMTAIVCILDLALDSPPLVSNSTEKLEPPSAGTLRWVDIQEQSESEMVLLSERFRFHPLTLEDCLHFDQRPKVEEHDDYLYDHLVRIYESIDAARDLLGNALDAYVSMNSSRTNEIMKRLTLLSAVFLPLTFITGFFGQNFEHLPFRSDALM